MKQVYIFTTDQEYSGGMILIAADNKNEAFKLLSTEVFDIDDFKLEKVNPNLKYDGESEIIAADYYFE